MTRISRDALKRLKILSITHGESLLSIVDTAAYRLLAQLEEGGHNGKESQVKGRKQKGGRRKER